MKENYDRLITIHKGLQEQSKDKYAQDILIADLRTNYEGIKKEDLKEHPLLQFQPLQKLRISSVMNAPLAHKTIEN